MRERNRQHREHIEHTQFRLGSFICVLCVATLHNTCHSSMCMYIFIGCFILVIIINVSMCLCLSFLHLLPSFWYQFIGLFHSFAHTLVGTFILFFCVRLCVCVNVFVWSFVQVPSCLFLVVASPYVSFSFNFQRNSTTLKSPRKSISTQLYAVRRSEETVQSESHHSRSFAHVSESKEEEKKNRQSSMCAKRQFDRWNN